MPTNNEQQNGAKQSTSIQQEAYNDLPRVNQISLDNEKLRNEINALKYRLEEAKRGQIRFKIYTAMRMQRRLCFI